jgi:hypothetical protein
MTSRVGCDFKIQYNVCHSIIKVKGLGFLYSDAYRTTSTALHSWQTTGKNGGGKRRIHRW